MSNHLPTDYQSFIHKSRYARWLDEDGRRETWSETVERYMINLVLPTLVKNTGWPESLKLDWAHPDNKKLYDEIEQAILGLEVMPSMRALMTAGTAFNRDNTAGYNCSYMPVDDVKSFDEAMFILLCGTGVGFSVERQFISKAA